MAGEGRLHSNPSFSALKPRPWLCTGPGGEGVREEGGRVPAHPALRTLGFSAVSLGMAIASPCMVCPLV